MEVQHLSIMNEARKIAWRAGLDLDAPEDFSGKGACIHLHNTHDVQMTFFVQGFGSSMRCGFMIPNTEDSLMQLLDHQITTLTIPLKLNFRQFNHSMNRSTVQRGARTNSRIYLDYEELGELTEDEKAQVIYSMMKGLIPAVNTYRTMRDLHMFQKAISELLP